MAHSNNAITKTFIKEGKLSYSNKDSGGLTYLGMAYRKWPKVPIWSKIFKCIQQIRPDLTDSILKAVGTNGPIITLTQIEESKINSLLEPLRKEIIIFYKNEFWDVIGADGILSQTFAESFFDFSVNVGSGTGAIILQKYLGVKPDGAFGKNSLAKLNSELLKNAYNVHIDFTILKIKKYCSIVTDNKAQLANFHGWLNRSFEVFNEIFEIEIIETLSINNSELIPEELKKDISKLLRMYKLNKEYSMNKTPANLTGLHNKITEIINEK